MDSFPDVVARLKHQLRVSKDSEVAEFLGLSRTAFAERKKRESFPDKELIALASERPDLALDLVFIFTGQMSSAIEQNQFARMIETSIKVDAEKGTKITERAADAIKKHGAHLKKRKPAYEQLTATLDLCGDEDVALMQAIAARLMRGKQKDLL